MIQLPVVVDQLDQGEIWLSTESSSGCDRCARGRGCGAIFWMRLMPPRRLRMSARFPVRKGDNLTLEIKEQVFLLLVLFAYLLPLIGILVTAGVGQWFWGEAGALTLVGLLIVGWVVAMRAGWTAKFYSRLISGSGLLLKSRSVAACVSAAKP